MSILSDNFPGTPVITPDFPFPWLNGETHSLTCTFSEPNSDPIFYAWWHIGGTVIEQGSNMNTVTIDVNMLDDGHIYQCLNVVRYKDGSGKRNLASEKITLSVISEYSK